jgi:predicted glycogen debranching enzyme
MGQLDLARPAFATADSALTREWLLTNGLGSYASGTVALANTRRYHGVLVASLRPPLERVVMVAKVDASVSYRGRRFELACNEFADGTLAPRGFEQLASFYLDGVLPVWTYSLGDALLEQRQWMVQGENTTHIQYRVLHAGAPLALELTPLCTYRDYHAHARGCEDFAVDATADGCTVTAIAGARPYRLQLDRGKFLAAPDCHWNFRHRLEAERGLDAEEDLFRPGLFTAELQPGETITLTVSAERNPTRPALLQEMARQRALLATVPTAAPAWVRQLTLAADQFVVARSGDSSGTTIIAGYPWFGDWGRDTMIALPGLTLATGRHREAASILRTFAQHISQGMLPNRFPDDGEVPEYNTVDATLWYFHALAEYLQATHDMTLLREIYPRLREIIDWHLRGTRYGIQVDPRDGLLRAGASDVQLTWMDAKVGDWVVTPRTGKAVEINALWHFALLQMHRWADALGESAAARQFQEAAHRTAAAFAAAFWCDRTGCLYDVRGRRARRCAHPSQSDLCSVAGHESAAAGATARGGRHLCTLAADPRRIAIARARRCCLRSAVPRRAGAARQRLPSRHGLELVARAVRHRTSSCLRRCTLCAGTTGRVRAASGRGLHRLHQRDIRWQRSTCAEGLCGAGLERRGNSARLAPARRNRHQTRSQQKGEACPIAPLNIGVWMRRPRMALPGKTGDRTWPSGSGARCARTTASTVPPGSTFRTIMPAAAPIGGEKMESAASRMRSSGSACPSCCGIPVIQF